MRETLRYPLPVIESGKTYAPNSLALEILNLQATPEGTLRAVRGPTVLVPNYGAGFPAQYGRMHGIYHASLDSGTRDVMLIRTGDKLCVQRGYQRNLETLQGGLSDDANPRFPDQFCEVGGRVIWTNGVDRALVYDGYKLLPLGYDRAPGAVTVHGPAAAVTTTNQNSEVNASVYRNASGYAHPGRIGTPGDILNGQQGCVRNGVWYYYARFLDDFGNLSPRSPVSGPATIRSEDTATLYNKDFLAWNKDKELAQYAVQIDDLTKQFLVTGIPIGPEGTIARVLERTMDTIVNPSTPFTVVTIEDNCTTVYPDNHADSELYPSKPDCPPMPTFRVMCAHAGGLVIGNTPANPGIVGLSVPGFPGMIRAWIFPDPNGSEVRAVASFDGRVFAYTIDTVYEILEGPDGIRSVPVGAGYGCVAPSSVKPTGFGPLIWRGPDGFNAYYAGKFEHISEDDKPLMVSLSSTYAAQAVAEWCPETNTYMCAVTPGGGLGNNLIVCFGGNGWRREDHGIRYAGLTRTKDMRPGGPVVVGCGRKHASADYNVYALNRETRHFAPPTKTYKFRSHWLRMDPTGRDRFTVTTVYVGFVESVANTKVAWRAYRNMRRDVIVQQQTSTQKFALTLAAPDLAEHLSNIVVGTGKLRDPRLFWKKFDVKLAGVDSFAFDLEGLESAGEYLHIAAIAFEAVVVDDKGASVSRE